MNLFEAVIYGIIQGITEFLPISSSGHLILFPWLLGWKDPGLAFNVALHWGTLLGVVIYYRKDIISLVLGFGRSLIGNKNPENVLPWKIGMATLPAALAGFVLEDAAETFFRSPWIIAIMLASVGALLFIADKKTQPNNGSFSISWFQAMMIGCAQALALVPGTSRSGITITVALFLSVNRSSAVRFSFLLSVPIILGAGIMKLDELVHNLGDPILLTAIGTSALAGYGAIHFLVKHVQTKSFTPFVIYRFLLAGFILVLLITK